MITNSTLPVNTALPSLDADVFIPINPGWRKVYYNRVLKKRAWAFLLDSIINYIILFIIAFITLCARMLVIHYFTGKEYVDIDINEETISLLSIIITNLVVVVVAIMESSKKKGSFGKRIMKIEVSDNYGNALSLSKSFLRNLLKALTCYSYLLVIPLIIQIVTYRKTNKLFHDQFSNTLIGERL